MVSQFATPGALVEALHNRVDGARVRLWEWLREPVRRLMEQLRNRHHLPHSLDRLTQNALHAAETFVRTRPPGAFAATSVAAFRAAVLLQVAKQTTEPFGGRRDGPVPVPDPLPESKSYVCHTVYLPYEKVGGLWFGGDWYGGMEADGTLWVIVADITGHGYCASLLANTLPAVWRACWSNGRRGETRPNDILAAMHDMLGDCLPEGVYAECTLLRLAANGQVTVAPAGGSRLPLRRADRGPSNCCDCAGRGWGWSVRRSRTSSIAPCRMATNSCLPPTALSTSSSTTRARCRPGTAGRRGAGDRQLAGRRARRAPAGLAGRASEG